MDNYNEFYLLINDVIVFRYQYANPTIYLHKHI